jgi:hypothetical protein
MIKQTKFENCEIKSGTRTTLYKITRNSRLKCTQFYRLQPRAARQEDIDFQGKVRQQETETPPTQIPAKKDWNSSFIEDLEKATNANNHSDITEPNRFNDQDQNWDEFYSQLRSYFATEDWLSTFDHPTGPGNPNFNMVINLLKIYNKITMLCHKGTAITYIRMAAEFDG